MGVVLKYIVLVVTVLLLLCQTSVMGQGKKMLTSKDFDRWHHFFNFKLSANGKWICYNVQNPKGNDTLILQRTDSDFKQITIGGFKGQFSPKSDWLVFLRKRHLIYHDLKTHIEDSIADIDHFYFSKKGNHLIGESKKENKLSVIHLSSKRLDTLASVVSYNLSPDSSRIALVQRKEGKNLIRIIELGKFKDIFELDSYNGNISGLTWNTRGNGIAFFEAAQQKEITNENMVHYITFRENKPPFVSNKQSSTKLDSTYLIPSSKLFFSLDDEQLFFDIQSRYKTDLQTDIIHIWSSNAKILPPPNEELKNYERFLMCWHLKPNLFQLVNNEDSSVTMPTATGKHAIVLDKSPYLPHFDYQGIFVDLYIKDLITGKQKLIAKKINHQKNHIIASPKGKYITWFAGSNWWNYSIAKQSIRCVTCSTQTHFENIEYDRPGEKFPNDKPYWTKDDKGLLLSSFYDIWLFNPETDQSERLTNGNLSKTRFRVHSIAYHTPVRDYYLLYQTEAYNLEEGLIFKELNTQTLDEGFRFYRAGTPLQQIFFTDDKVNSIYKANETYLYVVSDFDKSPELWVQQSSPSTRKIIQHSNEHQKEFYWGKSELISYVSNGVPLKGALFYPADYHPNKKYPMIVFLYEKMSPLLRTYIKPSLHNSTGFNVTHLITAGYFILCPDIHYTINETGKSALESVMAGVDQALKTASIDRDNIGLYGHSFGGFEVSYIVGQTSRFKAAVSGAGWHDLVATYLSSDESNISNIWRFDTQQLRITDTFLSKAFVENSPMHHVAKITTPILLWTGMQDYRVNWRNSTKLQTALWRLKKESTLLLYPKEQHLFTNAKNQADLSVKTLEWFNYYLKRDRKPEWIN